MSYTRDWLETNPIDHTKFKNTPGGTRELKEDISDRLKSLIYGFISAETNTGFKKLPLYAQASDPSTVADAVILYGKDVSAKCEAHLVDEDGNIVRITKTGALDGESIRLPNNVFLKALKAGGGTVDLIKANASDKAELPIETYLAGTTAPTTDTQIPGKKYVDDLVNPKFDISTGHDHDGSDSKQLGAGGISGALGAWASKSVNTVYQAETDGFVLAFDPTTHETSNIEGYTDGNNPPTTIRQRSYLFQSLQGSRAFIANITMLVKKGDYWKVTSNITPTISWIPMGS